MPGLMNNSTKSLGDLSGRLSGDLGNRSSLGARPAGGMIRSGPAPSSGVATDHALTAKQRREKLDRGETLYLPPSFGVATDHALTAKQRREKLDRGETLYLPPSFF